MENHELPLQWVVKITEESFPILDEWRKSIGFGSNKSCKGYDYLSFDGWGCQLRNREIISFDLFKRYVYPKIQSPEENEPYKHDPELDQILIKLLSNDN